MVKVNIIKKSETITAIEELVGDVFVKNLFTGFGIFKNSIMFGLYQNDTFYLRAKNDLATFLKKHGAVPYCNSNSKDRLKISAYYQLPLTIIKNKKLFKNLIQSSISQVHCENIENELLKKSRIKDLFNLSIKHERLLAKVEIENVKKLKQVGAVEAFIRLKKAGYSINLLFYWNIAAALANKNVNALTSDEKQVLLKKLNIELSRYNFQTMSDDLANKNPL